MSSKQHTCPVSGRATGAREFPVEVEADSGLFRVCASSLDGEGSASGPASKSALCLCVPSRETVGQAVSSAKICRGVSIEKITRACAPNISPSTVFGFSIPFFSFPFCTSCRTA